MTRYEELDNKVLLNEEEALEYFELRCQIFENFIRKKLVLLKQFDNSHYAKLIDNIIELTDEEYELLKEVLNDDK